MAPCRYGTVCAGSRVYELMSPIRMVSASAVADPTTTPAAVTTPAAITAAAPVAVRSALKGLIFSSL